jgi:hypothetical protein
MRPYASTSATSGARSRTKLESSPVRTLCGWNTSKPRSIAKSFTAGAWGASPRPAGRSGCVTTPTTSAVSASAASEGTASAGVPKKTARTRIAPRKPPDYGLQQVVTAPFLVTVP